MPLTRPLESVALASGSVLPRGKALVAGSTKGVETKASNEKTGLWSPVYGQYLDLIHIPKAGGLSLESWSKDNGISWGAHMPWAELLPTKSQATFSSGVVVSASELTNGESGVAGQEGEYWLPTTCPAWHIPRREYVAQGGFDPYAQKRTFCSVR